MNLSSMRFFRRVKARGFEFERFGHPICQIRAYQVFETRTNWEIEVILRVTCRLK